MVDLAYQTPLVIDNELPNLALKGPHQISDDCGTRQLSRPYLCPFGLGF